MSDKQHPITGYKPHDFTDEVDPVTAKDLAETAYLELCDVHTGFLVEPPDNYITGPMQAIEQMQPILHTASSMIEHIFSQEPFASQPPAIQSVLNGYICSQLSESMRNRAYSTEQIALIVEDLKERFDVTRNPSMRDDLSELMALYAPLYGPFNLPSDHLPHDKQEELGMRAMAAIAEMQSHNEESFYPAIHDPERLNAVHAIIDRMVQHFGEEAWQKYTMLDMTSMLMDMLDAAYGLAAEDQQTPTKLFIAEWAENGTEWLRALEKLDTIVKSREDLELKQYHHRFPLPDPRYSPVRIAGEPIENLKDSLALLNDKMHGTPRNNTPLHHVQSEVSLDGEAYFNADLGRYMDGKDDNAIKHELFERQVNNVSGILLPHLTQDGIGFASLNDRKKISTIVKSQLMEGATKLFSEPPLDALSPVTAGMVCYTLLMEQVISPMQRTVMAETTLAAFAKSFASGRTLLPQTRQKYAEQGIVYDHLYGAIPMVGNTIIPDTDLPREWEFNHRVGNFLSFVQSERNSGSFIGRLDPAYADIVKTIIDERILPNIHDRNSFGAMSIEQCCVLVQNLTDYAATYQSYHQQLLHGGEAGMARKYSPHAFADFMQPDSTGWRLETQKAREHQTYYTTQKTLSYATNPLTPDTTLDTSTSHEKPLTGEAHPFNKGSTLH